MRCCKVFAINRVWIAVDCGDIWAGYSRDFQQDTYSLIFTKTGQQARLSRWKMGRFFRGDNFCFQRTGLGVDIGTFMPWADKTRMAPIHLWELFTAVLLADSRKHFLSRCLVFLCGSS